MNDENQLRIDHVIALVTQAGFEARGWTNERVLGVLESTGQEISTPPRQRFVLPHNTHIRVTVGFKLTYFYMIDFGDVKPIASFETFEFEKIEKFLQSRDKKHFLPK